MHYGWNYFAKDGTKPTITAKDGTKVEPSKDFTLVLFTFFVIRIYKKCNFKLKCFGHLNRPIFWI